MRSPILDFAGKAGRAGAAAFFLLAARQASAQHKVTVPTRPPQQANATAFHDGHYGVRFQVPPGWELTRKDRQVSTFRLDARSAPPTSQMRGVASLGFNPFPGSVLSGALVYFSVIPHSDDKSCAAQLRSPGEPATLGEADLRPEPQNIGGMEFAHGYDEHGAICVEARDVIYTAFRKGSCYRFDLTLNTFCAASSGASELSQDQMRSLEEQMAGILSTVSLDWEKSGPQPVPAPDIPIAPAAPQRQAERNASRTSL